MLVFRYILLVCLSIQHLYANVCVGGARCGTDITFRGLGLCMIWLSSSIRPDDDDVPNSDNVVTGVTRPTPNCRDNGDDLLCGCCGV